MAYRTHQTASNFWRATIGLRGTDGSSAFRDILTNVCLWYSVILFFSFRFSMIHSRIIILKTWSPKSKKEMKVFALSPVTGKVPNKTKSAGYYLLHGREMWVISSRLGNSVWHPHSSHTPEPYKTEQSNHPRYQPGTGILWQQVRCWCWGQRPIVSSPFQRKHIATRWISNCGIREVLRERGTCGSTYPFTSFGQISGPIGFFPPWTF